MSIRGDVQSVARPVMSLDQDNYIYDMNLDDNMTSSALGLSALVCPICQKSVQGRNRRQNMENHMLIHTGVRPHKCPLCAYSSTQLGNLRRHMRNVHKIQQEIDVSNEECWSVEARNTRDTLFTESQSTATVATNEDILSIYDNSLIDNVDN